MLFKKAFYLASTDTEENRTKDLYMAPVFTKLNKWIAGDIADIQLGFFILIRGLVSK
jgi:hypothetical protein